MVKKAAAEKPRQLGTRGYKKHRKILKKWASKLNISQGEINRRAIEEFDSSRLHDIMK